MTSTQQWAEQMMTALSGSVKSTQKWVGSCLEGAGFSLVLVTKLMTTDPCQVTLWTKKLRLTRPHSEVLAFKKLDILMKAINFTHLS